MVGERVDSYGRSLLDRVELGVKLDGEHGEEQNLDRVEEELGHFVSRSRI